jgi:hypothetical protein
VTKGKQTEVFIEKTKKEQHSGRHFIFNSASHKMKFKHGSFYPQLWLLTGTYIFILCGKFETQMCPGFQVHV